MKLFKTRQGMATDQLSGVALGVLIFVITIAIGATVLQEFRDTRGEQFCVGGYWNATSEKCETSTTDPTELIGQPTDVNLTMAGLDGQALFSSFTTIIVLIAIASVILGLIAVAFGGFRGG